MALNIVQNSCAPNQQVSNSMEGENMLGRAFNLYLDQLIRENCKHIDGCYSLFACDIPYEDRKIFLSYLVNIDDYKDYISNKTRERIAIKEYEDQMQYLINNRIDDVWHEDMQDMGRKLCHCNQTGEPYYVK